MTAPSVSIVLPVLIKEPWQRHLTEAAIKILRDTTQVPFELIVVETESQEFSLVDHDDRWYWGDGDGASARTIHRGTRTTLAKDINAGLDAATGDFIGWTGNDIITKPGWLEALLECFDRYQDCGIASLRCAEIGAGLAPKSWTGPQDGPAIMMGWYGPIVLFRKGWRLDEAFESIASDNDLVARIDQAGLRPYYNRRVVPLHLVTQTHDKNSTAYEAMTHRAHELFIQKWASSPSWIVSMILRGAVVFGREWER